MQVCPAEIGWMQVAQGGPLADLHENERVHTSSLMYTWLELCAHQLCVNICLCKDVQVGFGLAGVPMRSGYGHLWQDWGPYPWEGLCVCV